jgi:serine/threonine protein phosphatase PrpC
MDDVLLEPGAPDGGPAVPLFGVYDGHGGGAAARHCARRLHHLVAQRLQTVMANGGGEPAGGGGGGGGGGGAFAAAAEPPQLERLGGGGAAAPAPARANSCPLDSAAVEGALRDAFVQTDAELQAGGALDNNSGSTAVVALLTPGSIWLAWAGGWCLGGCEFGSLLSCCIIGDRVFSSIGDATLPNASHASTRPSKRAGDSRAVLVRSGEAVAATNDHRPAQRDDEKVRRWGGAPPSLPHVHHCCKSASKAQTNTTTLSSPTPSTPLPPAPQARIEKAGGMLLNNGGLRLMGMLATTRAIGDHDLQPYGLTPVPEVMHIPRRPDDEFLVGTMGAEGGGDFACGVFVRSSG